MRCRNVLVFGGGFQGLGLIKALRKMAGIRILVADPNEENVARYFADAFFPVPFSQEKQAFLDFILPLCARESVEAIFASTEHEVELLAPHYDAFAASGVVAYVSGSSLLKLAWDKLLFYRWLIEEGLPSLPCYISPMDDDAIFPLIGKPRRGWGARGLHVLADREAFLKLTIDQNQEFIWQPCLHEFDEYSVDFSISVDGNISPLAFRRRIRSKNGFAILCEPGAPAHVRETARHVLERTVPLGARGPMNLQILRAGDPCWVSDLNSRAGTSMPLSLAVGFNPIAFLLGSGAAAPAEADVINGFPAPGSHARTFRYLEERSVPDLKLDEVRGVVFELDDTLLDQKAWMIRKLELTWHEEKTVLPARTTFLSTALQIIEEGNHACLFDALCLQLGLADAIRVRMIETYNQTQPKDCPLYDDVQATLRQLRRLGYRIAIATDAPAASQRQKLDACGLLPLVDAVVLAAELGTKKPDPKVFEECARLLDLRTEQVVMVGNNVFRDVQGSCNAGYRHAFHIQREGVLLGSNLGLARRVGSLPSTCTSITSLNELFWYLIGCEAVPQRQ
jgi:HAD superfamily hydrolase (TIGR01549 family)